MYLNTSISSPKRHSQCILWSMVLILITTLTTFTIVEVQNLKSDESSVIRVILNSLGSTSEKTPSSKENQQMNKFVLINLDSHQGKADEFIKTIVTKVENERNPSELPRKTREIVDVKNTTEKSGNKNSYYEEQTPVVVYSKTDEEAPMAYPQEAPIPYQLGSHEEQPFYNDASDEDESDYTDEEKNFYRPQLNDRDGDEQDPYQARSSQSPQYDTYYRQWHFATPAPAKPPPLPPSSPQINAKASFSSLPFTQQSSAKGNRKLSDVLTASATGGQSDPYAAYLDDYDYMSSPSRNSNGGQEYRYPQQQQQQVAAYQPQSSSQSLQKQAEGENSEMSFLGILKTLKTMWDLYQSFASAWNSMAENRNRQEELAKQKLKQRQELRINSRKPPKIQSKTKSENPNRRTKKPATTTTKKPTTTTTAIPNGLTTTSNAEDENVLDESVKVLPTDKVEPRKGTKGDTTPVAWVESLRKKRDTTLPPNTDVGEGRYIKGDPLKGYYDFVITEGSYKFWAVFQVGTALLIIYSTFAAIYYSKVNPLVSDYDYTDYLGGGRSMSGGDLDFVDDEDNKEVQHSTRTNGWFDWMPQSGHSVKFILDAIDKMPVDHQDANKSNSDGDGDGDADVHIDTRVDGSKHLNESTQKQAM